METTAIQYVGIDVHQATLVICVMDSQGRRVMETTVATSRDATEQALRGLTGRVHVAFEEGTQAQWLHDVIVPLVERVVVCNPRESRSGKNKSDRIDGWRLANRLRMNDLVPVYHKTANVQTLKQLVQAYEALVADSIRAKLRFKAIFRGQAIPTPGESVYQPARAEQKIKELKNTGAAFRARQLLAQIAQLDQLRAITQAEMTREAKRHRGYKLLSALPYFGPVRTAQLLAIMVTPHRFRTKRQVWRMAGLAVISHSTADRTFVNGRLKRSKRRPMTRGLNQDHNATLKGVFMSAAADASRRKGSLKDFYDRLVARGLDESIAKVTLARKIAAYTLRLWKKGESFEPAKLTMSNG